ncbi:hypothetical protein INT43_005064 [Umbelopsis isabellina]|uniref:Rhodanese domain-containing protein n=1 Tax=Mortierella isabellina TaxID=91625 RepID=A0A8H7U7A4_MORIS|nr:hypothetical protein INT43_005064 [Umbelopsis isabellina]
MSVKIIDYDAIKAIESLNDKQVYLIDVRDVDEFQAGHIPNALNIPLTEFRTTMEMPNEHWISVLGRDKPSSNDRLVIYCRSGRRSNLASQDALELMFFRVENYAGSWNEYATHVTA